jgi:pyruvate/2-oxoglutarate dehydrogenase complex dihydrolipoamide dehydrogenase (E3) component
MEKKWESKIQLAQKSKSKIKARKDILVNGSREGIEKSIADNDNITLLEVKRIFINSDIAVNDQNITATQIFINVGARAVIPKEYKQVDYLTNIDILELTQLPEHLMIMAGVILAWNLVKCLGVLEVK